MDRIPSFEQALKERPDDDRARLLEMWRQGLLLPGFTDPLASALAELSEYFHISVDEARHRCEHWELDSIKEWESANRDTAEGLLDFYRTTESWTFDTVWYHAQQCIGEQFPESVAIAHGLRQVQPGHMLDFGAGPGSTGLFFHNLGWKVAMADISTTMQSFARWRCTQRSVPADFYDTSRQELPAHEFDLITAIDVVAHIPDWKKELVRVHRALKVGGIFVFNIDARPKARENQWHLYEYHYPLLRIMRRAGFNREPKIEFFYVYRKDLIGGTLQRSAHVVFDDMRYNRLVSMGGQLYRAGRQLTQRGNITP